MKINPIIPLFAANLMLAAALSSCSDRGAIAAPPGVAREILVAVSPHLDSNFRKTLWPSLGRLILEQAHPGDMVTIYDGLELKQVVSLTVPNEKVMEKNPRARATRLAPEIKILKAFLDTAPAVDATDGALLVPQLVELVARRAKTGRHTSMLLVGSPLYQNPKDVTWTFADRRYPSDAHFAADQNRTTFGCANRATSLEGVAVYQIYPGDVFEFERHRLAVERFWRRWFAAQGAKSGMACGDIDSVMSALASGTTGPLDVAGDADHGGDEADKITMLTATDAQAEPEAKAEDSWIVEATPPPPADPPTAAAPRSPMVADLRIGIRWTDAVDIDLYAKPANDAEELYFGRPRTVEGVHEKDHVSAPAGVHGFETVRFSKTVDIRSAHVAVNLYRGQVSQGCDCEIRVLADGEVFTKTVHLAAAGTRGKATPTRATDPSWAIIDLATMLGIERGTMAANPAGTAKP